MWDGLISLAFLGVIFALVLISTLTMFIGLGRSIENFNLFQRMAERLDQKIQEINTNGSVKTGYKYSFGENFFYIAITKNY